jgi:hypothetical protein
MIDGRDAFDDVLKKDETVKDSQFAIRQMINFLPVHSARSRTCWCTV